MTNENKIENADPYASEAYLTRIRTIMDSFNSGESDTAIGSCEEVLREYPEGPEPYFFLGVAAFVYHDQGRALELVERAHTLDPDCREYADTLAVMYAKVGKMTDSLYYGKLATALQPHKHFTGLIPTSLTNLQQAFAHPHPPEHILDATRFFNQRRFTDVIESCARNLRLNPKAIETYRLLGRAQLELNEPDKAVAAFHAATYIDGETAADFAYLGLALTHMGRHEESKACLEEARRLDPNSTEVFAITQRARSYAPDETAETKKARAQEWQQANIHAKKKRKSQTGGGGHRLRVGILSDSLNKNDTSDIVTAFFKGHDKNLIELYCYQSFPFKDTYTQRYEAMSNRWTDLIDIDDETAAAIIEGDQLDILVDLSTEPDGRNLGILARRPARSVVRWIGAPDAAGTPGATHFISDAMTEKADKAVALRGQKGITLNAPLVAVGTMNGAAFDGPVPAEDNGFVTFGSRFDLALITPKTAATWARILKAAPNSVLYLGVSPSESTELKIMVTEMFSHFGIANRITFQLTEDADTNDIQLKNITFLSKVDIFLDTFPVNGVMDSIDALSMGIPVVTLAGESRAGLMGASILTAAERPEWIASNVDEYVDITTAMAADIDALVPLRKQLRSAVGKTNLFNPTRTVRALEQALISISA